MEKAAQVKEQCAAIKQAASTCKPPLANLIKRMAKGCGSCGRTWGQVEGGTRTLPPQAEERASLLSCGTGLASGHRVWCHPRQGNFGRRPRLSPVLLPHRSRRPQQSTRPLAAVEDRHAKESANLEAPCAAVKEGQQRSSVWSGKSCWRQSRDPPVGAMRTLRPVDALREDRQCCVTGWVSGPKQRSSHKTAKFWTAATLPRLTAARRSLSQGSTLPRSRPMKLPPVADDACRQLRDRTTHQPTSQRS